MRVINRWQPDTHRMYGTDGDGGEVDISEWWSGGENASRHRVLQEVLADVDKEETGNKNGSENNKDPEDSSRKGQLRSGIHNLLIIFT